MFPPKKQPAFDPRVGEIVTLPGGCKFRITGLVRDSRPGSHPGFREAPLVLLTDQDAGRSMTNSAETVCLWVRDNYPGHRVIYRDTDGRWDEMVTNSDGSFRMFRPFTTPLGSGSSRLKLDLD